MLAYTYVEHGKFELLEKLRPQIKDARDAIVRVTLGSICTSDLHINLWDIYCCSESIGYR